MKPPNPSPPDEGSRGPRAGNTRRPKYFHRRTVSSTLLLDSSTFRECGRFSRLDYTRVFLGASSAQFENLCRRDRRSRKPSKRTQHYIQSSRISNITIERNSCSRTLNTLRALEHTSDVSRFIFGERKGKSSYAVAQKPFASLVSRSAPRSAARRSPFLHS